LERVLYNTVLGALPPSGDGYFFYYSDYHSTAQKRYFGEKWPCCSGTLPQVVADYLISAYFHSADGIYVNLFLPSEVSWKIGGQPARLIQMTNYPEAESTELRLEISAPAEFTVHVRIPGWLQSPAQISVNGKDASLPAEPRSFAAIRRVWRNNDTLQISMPFSVRQEAIDDHHPQMAALMRGPLMMVALDPQLKVEANLLRTPGGLKSVSNSGQELQLKSVHEDIRFVPFYTVGDQSYTTYLELA
jgi:DUF1680 family protein